MPCHHILLFTLIITTEIIQVFGYEGGEVKVSCSYDEGYESYEKYLCRNDCGSEDVLITTTEAGKSKYSIRDDTNRRVFTTTISNLLQSDAGKYWCGVTRTGKDYYPGEVELKVIPDNCCHSFTRVQSYDGDSVSIRCLYDSQYQNNLKYICRGHRPSTCLQQAVVTSNNKPNTRFSLTDDKVSSVTVTITSVTRTDSGSYLCGVQTNTGLDAFSAVNLEVKENTCCDSSTTVQQYEGGSVSIHCPYESQYRNNLKYICRENRPSTCLQQAVVTSNNKPNTRLRLTDNKVSSFTVTITSVTRTDSGSYLCGVQINTGPDIFSAVDLEVKENTCCDSSTKVQQYEGGSVSIHCSYESQYQNNLKYICRGHRPSTCLQQAVVTSNNKPNTRFSLTDDKVSSVTVTITNLTRTDSGSYLCGLQRNTGLDVFSAVDLEVKDNTCCDSSTRFQGYEGDSVSIHCPYESQDQNNLKYICRGHRPSTCLQQAVVTSNNKPNTRFNLTDDKVSSFTVTITNLTRTDSGSYLCGVHRNTGLDVFSAVDLDFKEWCCVKSIKLSGIVGHPLTMHCPYPPKHKANRKFLCKGDHHKNCTDMIQNSSGQTDVRVTLQDDVVSSSFLVVISELEAGDAGTYWCGSDPQWSLGNYTKIHLSLDVWASDAVVYIVPAVLLCVLIVVVVIVYICKCRKVKETGPTVTTTKATDAAKIYENDDVAVYAKHKKSKRDHTCAQQQSVYGNFNVEEDIYCNEFYSNRR